MRVAFRSFLESETYRSLRSADAKLVALVLVEIAEQGDGEPTNISRLAEQCDTSRHHVRIVLERLERAGTIKVTHGYGYDLRLSKPDAS